MKTIVFGYSPNPERYSHKAYHLLKEYGHETIAVHLREEVDFSSIPPAHTVTLYVGPQLQEKFRDVILALKAERFIFNPGTENLSLMNELRTKGKEVIEACTLVLLRTNQYE